MIASPEFLKARLSEGGITRAAVIDEAFDDENALAKVNGEDVFWAEIDARPEWKSLLEAKNIPCDDFATFQLDGLPKLWQQRKAFSGEIVTAIAALFLDAEQNLADPATVTKYLGDLGLTTVSIGAKPNNSGKKGASTLPNIPAEAQLVFLDYDLEGNPKLTGGRTRLSEQIAGRLAERKEHTPFLVIFSNKPNARALSEGFRKRTGFLRGTFTFIPKQDARDFLKLCKHLSETCLGLKGLGNLQYFFFALKRRLEEVAEKVETEVMQLDVQDHAFIQRLALQDEGACLGEYMLDFFGAVLSHELRDGPEVQAAKRQLDAFPFEGRHLPFSESPSAPIQRLYRAVLTDPGITDAEPHPQTKNGRALNAKGKEYVAPPLLMFGDIFASKPKKPVYVVMNPACDLQYAPKRRDPKLEISVILMKGHLEAITQPRSNSQGMRMELLQFNNKNWRILWDHQQVESVPLGKFDEWKKHGHYKRIARLSLPHGLKLQQMWLAELGRVGLPVNLPFYDSHDMQILALDANGEWKPTGAKCARGTIVSRHPTDSKEVSHFTLTPEGRNFLFEQLSATATDLAAHPVRKTAADSLLKQAKTWNMGLTETPHKIANGLYEDISGLLFAWRQYPKLNGLSTLSDVEKAKLSEPERKSVAKREKVAMIVLLHPLPPPSKKAAVEKNKEVK